MKKIEVKYKINERGCWECCSHAKNSDGYPCAIINGVRDRIYRHYYRKYIGEIPHGMVVRHTCDNRLCINPSHLLLGTHADNVRDRVKRNRSACGVNNGRAKLCNNDVLEILHDKTLPKMKLAARYDVDPKVIRDIKSGKIWSSITGL